MNYIKFTTFLLMLPWLGLCEIDILKDEYTKFNYRCVNLAPLGQFRHCLQQLFKIKDQQTLKDDLAKELQNSYKVTLPSYHTWESVQEIVNKTLKQAVNQLAKDYKEFYAKVKRDNQLKNLQALMKNDNKINSRIFQNLIINSDYNPVYGLKSYLSSLKCPFGQYKSTQVTVPDNRGRIILNSIFKFANKYKAAFISIIASVISLVVGYLWGYSRGSSNSIVVLVNVTFPTSTVFIVNQNTILSRLTLEKLLMLLAILVVLLLIVTLCVCHKMYFPEAPSKREKRSHSRKSRSRSAFKSRFNSLIPSNFNYHRSRMEKRDRDRSRIRSRHRHHLAQSSHF